MPVLAGAEPFQYTGPSGTGVLLCHGFTGTPATMRPWGRPPASDGHRAVLNGVDTDPARVTEVVLHDSCHVATLDGDVPLLFARSSEFAAAGRQVGTK